MSFMPEQLRAAAQAMKLPSKMRVSLVKVTLLPFFLHFSMQLFRSFFPGEWAKQASLTQVSDGSEVDITLLPIWTQMGTYASIDTETSPEQDLRLWWNSKGDLWKDLARMQRALHCVVASAVSVERVWSVCVWLCH